MKVKTSVTLDAEIVMRLKLAELNLSQEVNDFLIARLSIKKDIEEEEIIKELSSIEEQLKALHLKKHALNNKLNDKRKDDEDKQDSEVNATLDALKASGALADAI